MTTFTRPSRLDKRDAYLIAKHGDDVQALLIEMREHATREPFSTATASFEKMSERYNAILAYSSAVLAKFPYAQRSFFHNLSGAPVVFKAEGDNVEVVLRVNKARHGYNQPKPAPEWEYRTLLLPAYLFGGKVSDITTYTRLTLRANRDDKKRAERAAAEAEQRRLIAERAKLDADIAAAEKKLETMRARKGNLAKAA